MVRGIAISETTSRASKLPDSEILQVAEVLQKVSGSAAMVAMVSVEFPRDFQQDRQLAWVKCCSSRSLVEIAYAKRVHCSFHLASCSNFIFTL